MRISRLSQPVLSRSGAACSDLYIDADALQVMLAFPCGRLLERQFAVKLVDLIFLS